MSTRWVQILLALTTLCCVVQLQETTSIRWVDYLYIGDMDTFFDRAVFIIIKKNDSSSFLKTHIGLAPGVLVTEQLVLTSFNPFREYIKDKDMRKEIHVSVLQKRHITDWKSIQYTLQNYSIDCARQVIPVSSADEIWASDEGQQGLLHDLFVMRLNMSLKLEPYAPNLYSFGFYGKQGISTRIAGPMLTVLARPTDEISQDITFASISFINKRHMFKSCLLRSHTFSPQDNVETECDGWMPRAWGLFICIRNVEHFKGVGSGALLFSHNKLFGVGSFILKKGKDSILVFTDVRQYFHLIANTCTFNDQALGMKPNSTTSTTATSITSVSPTDTSTPSP